ncbi:uncharacterized protein LOC105846612 [Hydra vulgaris]|uniref:uncharacterized protein LOC105846612 n=1 Tax=Hydra vulgaris TaxID=6087 RepID=UPI001F5E9E31|nr:uncharacterized protein LOC105846612 [Hydra vulgaris]
MRQNSGNLQIKVAFNKKASLLETVNVLLNGIGAPSNVDIEGQRISTALLLLPVVFGEDIDRFISLNKNPQVSTPSITIRCAGETNVFNVDDAEISVMLDGIVIAKSKTVSNAVTSLVAAYLVYEIVFDTKLKKTLDFAANHVCGVTSYITAPFSQRILNKLL